MRYVDLVGGIVSFLFVFYGCQFQKPDVKPIPDAGTGGTFATGGNSSTGGSSDINTRPFADDCMRAEATVCGLKCSMCTTPKGTPFLEVCRRAEADGRSFCPANIATIKSCSEFNAASKACRK